MTRVVFLLIPGVHLLDLAGPAQVFSSAADLVDGYELSYVGDMETVLSHQGVPLGASRELPSLDVQDLVFVPGWRSPRIVGTGHLSDRALEWLRTHHANGGTVASVCAGADALGRAGLLDGRRCTTHHELQEELERRYPAAKVVRDVLYVEDGRIVTSAGIASGIDLALHLVAMRHGPVVAAAIARTMVVYARRNGDDQQASVLLRHRSHVNETVHRVQDVIEARLAERLSLADLAMHAGCSERTVTRLFTRATGMTPLKYQQALRVERAEHLIGQGATMETAARSVGFEDARMLRRLRNRLTA
ncbi:Transcriptional regulator GlxA family, contains an amidase domain and an AraC-type DNA-binding HTH domain [Lentzea fradiae]|uniref:Transcriptional regulator GlxA family, contains an amidase domain and an AraC-type DNA-binding HTH domain n=1 Tax=Lentzea fradiae TaxID=200378 RepID=A0A1G7K0R6_9PSEU|nr:DJ-1/PfpI family protein [Lentzea fradiae]SDF30868.1 Transcriptional regulator GlxA family, contains an amidase domain and an AraC-type DNA-binding HTH domain [Lentzea fradiae]